MKKLGFGCMRLPMMGGADGEVDKREFCRMVDTFLAEGFCYFDTAHGYLNGKSEKAPSLSYLAQALGYYDQAHFNHDFKSVCGVSPTVYQQKLSDFYRETHKFPITLF